MTGGTITLSLAASRNSHAHVSGGVVEMIVEAQDSSVITVTGGLILGGIEAQQSSVFSFSGGTAHGAVACSFSLPCTAELKILGGTIAGDLTALQRSVVAISGGALGDSIFALDNSSIKVVGTDFNHPAGPLAPTTGTLTRTLADGSPLNVSFGRASTAAIVLTPAVSTVPSEGDALLAALLLAAGLMGLAARRRSLPHRSRPVAPA